MFKIVLKRIVIWVSSIRGGRYAGKMIGFLDFCREVICHNEKVFAGQIYKRMDLNLIIPHDEDNKIMGYRIEPTDKIKVRIVFPGGCSWNNIHTLYDAFIKDDRFQTYVLAEEIPQFIEIMEKVGCRYVSYDNYSIEQDRPDILVATFYSSYDKGLVYPGCRKYVKCFVAAIPNPVMNEENNDIHWQYINRSYQPFNPDYYLADPLVYNSLKGYVENKKLVSMSNPQFDEIFKEVGKNHPVPESWNKLKGKKVFLWATDHGINESYPKNGFTVDLYLSDMINYFNQHHEIGLIFRPHPQFIREMLRKKRFWNTDDVQKLRTYIDLSPNIVWDDTHDYCCAYDTCDALIVDANCSITLSFLTTGKPICRLMRYDMKEWLISPELHDCYYYAHNYDECIEYMQKIIEGVDELKEKRKEAMKFAIPYFDGKNGERMKDYIVEDYFKNR